MGDWSDDLPSDGSRIVFVRPDASFGIGTRDDPTSLEWALAMDTPIIALAKGRYEVDHALIGFDTTLLGACASETVIARRPMEDGFPAVVNAVAPEVTLRGLTLEPNGGGGVIATLVGGLTAIALELVDVRIEGATGFGILTTEGVRLSGTNVEVVDTQPGSVNGAAIQLGSWAQFHGLALRRNAGVGVRLSGAEADVTITDGWIADTSTDFGDGVTVFGGGRLALERVLVENAIGAGIAVVGTNSRAQISDSVVQGTRERGGFEGFGIIATDGGAVLLERSWVDANTTTGLAVLDGSMDAVDVVVTRTRLSTGDPAATAAGAGVQRGTLTLSRVVVSENEGGGIAVLAGGRVDVRDVSVHGTRSTPAYGAFGRGVSLQGGAMTAARLSLHANREAGIFIGSEASLTATDVRIEATRERACAETLCIGFGAGIGLVARDRGTADLERFAIRDNAFIGVQLLNGGAVSLRDGEVVGHPIGVNVQRTELDLADLSSGVRFENERNLARDDIPAPEPLTLP